jgi:hypothetical protein
MLIVRIHENCYVPLYLNSNQNMQVPATCIKFKQHPTRNIECIGGKRSHARKHANSQARKHARTHARTDTRMLRKRTYVSTHARTHAHAHTDARGRKSDVVSRRAICNQITVGCTDSIYLVQLHTRSTLSTASARMCTSCSCSTNAEFAITLCRRARIPPKVFKCKRRLQIPPKLPKSVQNTKCPPTLLRFMQHTRPNPGQEVQEVQFEPAEFWKNGLRINFHVNRHNAVVALVMT